jgi:hypothetical protein
MKTLSLYICGVAIALCLFMLYRNSRVLRVRLDFIDTPGLFPEAYMALPSYDAMLDHPKYWLLWSTEDWRAWVARQQQEVTP